MSGEELVRVEGVYKSFGPTKALVNVDLSINSGTIHGFIGENGSGKSTLSSIIAGAQPLDRGEMFVRGQPFSPGTMVEAQKYGVAMVVQERGTIPGLTVAENIFVGREKQFLKYGMVNRRMLNEAAAQALKKVGVTEIDPAVPVDTLNFEQQKIVEIARAMYDDPQILIVDETTTALSEYGRKIIYGIMNDMFENDKAVLFITHDLDELISICSNVTILRDGEVMASLEKDEMEVYKLRELMVGRKLEGDYYRSDNQMSFDEEVVLKTTHLSAEEGLVDFSMELHKGEILGVGGLTDCGMHELGRILFGIDRAITGEVDYSGIKIVGSTQAAIDNGMGYVSKNRDVEAIILNASIYENIVLPSLNELKKSGFITKKREVEFARKQAESLSIRCESVEQFVAQLSGGNKQKVVLGKWLGKEIKVLIMDCPTRGVDVGVKAAIYQLMVELKERGTAIIMISEELPELIGMSDRILILKNGILSGVFERGKDVSETEIIHYMI